MAGLSVHESGGGGYLILSRWVARGPMPQLEDGVRHGFKVSRFPDFWPFFLGGAYSLKGSDMCQGFLKGVEFGSLAPFSPPP